MNADDIPKDGLIAMLKEACWQNHDRNKYEGRTGYSLEVREETAYRDILYRGAKLYPTAEEAIVAEWLRTNPKPD